MKIRTIENLDVCGKFVLLRDDFNVQIVDGKLQMHSVLKRVCQQ